MSKRVSALLCFLVAVILMVLKNEVPTHEGAVFTENTTTAATRRCNGGWFEERNGQVIYVNQVAADDELLLTSTQGMNVRIPVQDIREQGRNTMGVRLMRLNEGDKVASVTKI